MSAPAPTAGKLISFEGSEGCGKSTQIARLAARLRAAGWEVVTTREPGGTATGEQIRNIIVHNAGGDEMCPETELLLFTAARAQLVREVIAPALRRGAIVLSDRYLDSSTVYQGIARNLPAGPVDQINRFAVGGILPDLTVLLDVPTEVGLQRARARATGLPDRMERLSAAFFDQVRAGYLQLARDVPDRVAVVDGARSPEAIEEQVWNLVRGRIG